MDLTKYCGGIHKRLLAPPDFVTHSNDLPPKYSLKLTKWQSGNGRKSDKIIQKIVLDNNNMNVKIIVKKCIDNIYIGMNIIEGSGKIDSFFLTNFTKLDTISCRVSDISFFEDSISLETINSYNYQIDDMMIVTDTSVLTLFYDQLWKQITVISKSNK